VNDTSPEEREIRPAVEFLRRWLGVDAPSLAVVLGSGLGGVASGLERAKVIGMVDIPGFPAPTVLGHAGRVRCGGWGGRSVLVLEGRTHLYEGHTVERVTRAVRILAASGVRDLILTNAAGSCNFEIPPGALMRATDLVSFFFRRMRGDRAERGLLDSGGRDRDACVDSNPHGVFDADLGRSLDAAAWRSGVGLARGVLGGILGPTYETAAEVRLLRRAGADAACMSTIPEAIAARMAGMRVAAVSLITNYATGVGKMERLEHADVVSRATIAAADLERVLREHAARP
jgi:purine-nucleoside phosphorylase